MATSRNAILLVIFCTIFTSLGQILWKFGVQDLNFTQFSTFLNLSLFLGFVAYGLGALLLIAAFRDGELSIVYPLAATSYVWVSLTSPLFFGDAMNAFKWTGVFLILLSVSLLGYGSMKVQHG
ncbi:hypothetical protein HYX14_05395 [Candidatus Woesearchaeota archaeon]|nr:hypothetical protein [Candidatus Woesearchaeota archaeon]